MARSRAGPVQNRCMSTPDPTPLSIAELAQRIHSIRGQRIVLDSDLAAFYGETTKRFNQQVRRNLDRFPADFMFQLDEEEFSALRLQSATLNSGRGQHRKYLPLAFTEHGAIMAATLLASPRATALSVHVVRAFVELKAMLASNRELRSKVRLPDTRGKEGPEGAQQEVAPGLGGRTWRSPRPSP